MIEVHIPTKLDVNMREVLTSTPRRGPPTRPSHLEARALRGRQHAITVSERWHSLFETRMNRRLLSTFSATKDQQAGDGYKRLSLRFAPRLSTAGGASGEIFQPRVGKATM